MNAQHGFPVVVKPRKGAYCVLSVMCYETLPFGGEHGFPVVVKPRKDVCCVCLLSVYVCVMDIALFA